MRKEVVYLVVAVLIALGIMLLSNWNKEPTTGFVVFEEYENQTSCEDAGYEWENETTLNCSTETINGAKIGWINSSGYVLTNLIGIDNPEIEAWNITEESSPVLIPAEKYSIDSETGIVTNITSAIYPDVNFTYSYENETCENITTGQCIGDVCDSSHLNLCLSESTCTTANGYWYDDSCNEDECSSDSHCGSGYECSSGSCEEIEEEDEEEDEEEEESESSQSTQTSTTSQTTAPVSRTELLVYEISDLELTHLQSKKVALAVENTGTAPVSACKIQPAEEFADWISVPEDSKNLNSGDGASFNFDLSIPEYAEIGDYTLKISVVCSYPALSQEKEFTVSVIKKTFDFNLTDVRKIKDDEVRARYVLSDLSGSDQSIQLNFVLLDNQSQKVSEISETKNLSANLSEKFDSILGINESLIGNLTLTVDLNSETYSSSVQEPIVLTAPSILGFAVLDRIGGVGSIVILVIAVAALVFSIFVIRKIRRAHKNKNS